MLEFIFFIFFCTILICLAIRFLKFYFSKKIEAKIYAEAYKEAKLDVLEESIKKLKDDEEDN